MNAGWIIPFIILGGLCNRAEPPWFRVDTHPANIWRIVGACLFVGGVILIANF
jgi:uncharacterized membrane protein YdcZ (DUF606 family)